MSIFNLFKRNNNANYLRDRNELEAAEILRNICTQLLPKEDLAKLSIGLYHLSFKRTSKPIYNLFGQSAANVINQSGNIGRDLGAMMFYSGLFKSINETLEAACKTLLPNPSIESCKQVVLSILIACAKEIQDSNY